MQIELAILTFLHDLFTVTWIGGMITLGLVVFPSAREALGMGQETRKLIDTVQERLSKLAYVSIAGLVLTGLLLARSDPAFSGLFRLDSVYSLTLTIKHLLVVAMIGIALYRNRILIRRDSPTSPAQSSPAETGSSQMRLKTALLFSNIALGITVLLLSAALAA